MNLVFASDWYIETKEILRDYVQPEPSPMISVTSPAKSCPADPASPTRTTCACSTP